MQPEGFSIATYSIVLLALVLLTVLTVGVSFIDLEAPWHVVAGLSIAAVKATLVVLFFMHALKSPALTWGAIGAAIFWLLLLIVLTCVDYFSRSNVPFSPGH